MSNKCSVFIAELKYLKTFDSKQSAEIWCYKMGLAKEVAGFTPSSCEDKIVLNDNVLILREITNGS